MNTRATMIALGTVLAIGMSAPSWAQGSAERSDNGGGHPGQAEGQPTAPQGGMTTGQGQGQGRNDDANRQLPNAPNAQTGGRPNNPNPGPTDRSGNVPSDNR